VNYPLLFIARIRASTSRCSASGLLATSACIAFIIAIYRWISTSSPRKAAFI